MSSSEENEFEGVQSTPDPQGMSKASWEPPWPESADLETRMAYGRALMGGYGLWLTMCAHSVFAYTETTTQNYLTMRSPQWQCVAFFFHLTSDSLLSIKQCIYALTSQL